MPGLSALDIMNVWERGRTQHPLDRALTLLSVARPEMSWPQLAALSVGQRDAQLLLLREETLGSTLAMFAECPQCRERLEWTLEAPRLAADWRPPASDEQCVKDGDYWVRFTLPNSADLAAAAGCPDVAAARHMLIERCIAEARQDGTAISWTQLPNDVLQSVCSRIQECDPLAEVLVDFGCPHCRHTGQMLLDIASFFWREICAQAQRLLREVDALARAYGWSEGQILSLSTARRQAYLDLVYE